MSMKVAVYVITLLTLVVAGSNKDAKLFVDIKGSTTSIDSVGGCAVDSTFVAAIRITGASKLFSYEFYLDFDTSSLKFESGKRDHGDEDNFLEKNGGSASFTAKLSKQDSTRILIGNFLLGDEEGECVSGDGPIGFIKFKHKKTDTTSLSISSVKLIDYDLNEDNDVKTVGGSVYPNADPVVFMRRSHVTGAPRVAVRSDKITVSFSRRTDWTVSVVNTLGRRLDALQGSGTRIDYALSNRDGRGSMSRALFVSVHYDGKNMVIPVIH